MGLGEAGAGAETRGAGWPVAGISDGDSGLCGLCGRTDPQTPPRVTFHCPASWLQVARFGALRASWTHCQELPCWFLLLVA